MNLTTATPVEIDTRLAEVHTEIGAVNAKVDYLERRVLDHSGLRVYVPATWTTRKSSYKVNGTFEDGLARLWAYIAAFEAYEASGYAEALRPTRLSDFAGQFTADTLAALVAERDTLRGRKFTLWAEANELEAEHTRRPWSRYYLVVSSAGHIHSSTRCKTCRRTTEYGWTPERSGMTEAEAIDDLGEHAEALCSVCFPSAPVAGKTKVTAAKAAKMSAGTVATPEAVTV